MSITIKNKSINCGQGVIEMREPYERDIKKEILEKCFDYLVRKGLAEASIKNLCEETGISSGSIYYWFNNKDEVILDTTEYGLTVVTNKLFDYAFGHIADIREVIQTFPDELMKYKNELRFIYQVTTSSQYGYAMRKMVDKLDITYDAYAKKLSSYMEYNYETLRPFVYLFISAAFDYIVWEDEKKIAMELNTIYKAITALY